MSLVEVPSLCTFTSDGILCPNDETLTLHATIINQIRKIPSRDKKWILEKYITAIATQLYVKIKSHQLRSNGYPKYHARPQSYMSLVHNNYLVEKIVNSHIPIRRHIPSHYDAIPHAYSHHYTFIPWTCTIIYTRLIRMYPTSLPSHIRQRLFSDLPLSHKLSGKRAIWQNHNLPIV